MNWYLILKLFKFSRNINLTQIRQKRKDLLMMASEQIRQQSRDLKKELDREIDFKLRMKIKEHENERVKLRIGFSINFLCFNLEIFKFR